MRLAADYVQCSTAMRRATSYRPAIIPVDYETCDTSGSRAPLLRLAMAQPALNFPLYERAEALGVLDGESALIVAPTATGKSHIGREAICRALARGAVGTHAYLVPFRTLATRLVREEPGRNRPFKEYVRLE